MNPGVCPQPHHDLPAGLSVEPAKQFGAGESAIPQQRDGPKPHLEPIGQRQQSNRDLSADAYTVMVQRLSQNMTFHSQSHAENQH